MGQRLLGADTTVSIVVDNELVAEIDSIKSFEVTYQVEILKEGFLGQTTDQRDEIYRGISGKIEMQLSSAQPLILADAVKKRAQRRTGGTRITIKSTFQFPSGDRAIYVVGDAKFGEIPINDGGRTEYVNMSLSFEADDMKFVTR